MTTTRLRQAAALATILLLVTPAGAGCGRDGEPAGAPTGAAPTGSPSPTVSPATPSPRPGEPTSPRTSRPEPPPTTRPAPTTATPPFPAALRGQDVERIPTSRRIVALTFDAGANADAVPSILATLADEQVRATFFLTGDFVRHFPQSAKSITAAGHKLANHSASHPHFPPLTDAQIRDQIRDAEGDIRSYAGGNPQPLFRFPFGDRNARTIGEVNDLGYVAVRWTVDSLGWQGTSGGRSVGSVTARVLDSAQPGQIVLMHVGSHPTDRSTLDADALPGVIAGLRQRGYEFVTLSALTG
jgi:peptidoglycan/xylan/chitin deacetylase (PgdA/CDA1 family)